MSLVLEQFDNIVMNVTRLQTRTTLHGADPSCALAQRSLRFARRV